MNKAFSCKTLNGDWFEDRAKPLKGVLADYGTRDYDTTNKVSFLSPSTSPSSETLGSNPMGLISIANFKEMEKQQRSDKTNWSLGGNLKPDTSSAGVRKLMSTSAATFGKGNKPDIIEVKTKTGIHAQRAGAPSVSRASRSVHGSSATGEVLKKGKDPQDNTAVQRSWLYDVDAMFSAMESKREPIDASYMSLNGIGEYEIRR